MIAHYGYKDGSGDYFAVIDTARCATCKDGPCVPACPMGALERQTDDYDDVVCAVKESFRNKLKYTCAPCKPIASASPPPCIAACRPGAIRQTW